MVEMLAKQVASPVQFVKGLNLTQAGARVFVEMGPKKALQGFAEDVLGEYGDVVSLFTNHPKFGDIVAFNQALCGLYAAGLGRAGRNGTSMPSREPAPRSRAYPAGRPPPAEQRTTCSARDVSDRSQSPSSVAANAEPKPSVVITGAALGLPGTERIFDDANVGRILRGEQFIDVIPHTFRRAMLDKHITRLVKSDSGGEL